MTKLYSKVSPKFLSAAAMALPLLAHAQQQTESTVSLGISHAIPYLVAIGMATSTCGLIFAGIKYSSGDPMAKESAKNVLIGSIMIASASGIGAIMRILFAS